LPNGFSANDLARTADTTHNNIPIVVKKKENILYNTITAYIWYLVLLMKTARKRIAMFLRDRNNTIIIIIIHYDMPAAIIIIL